MSDTKKVDNSIDLGTEWLTVREAAEALGVTRHAVYKAIWEERLRAERFRGLRVVRRVDVQRYADSRMRRVLAGGPGG